MINIDQNQIQALIDLARIIERDECDREALEAAETRALRATDDVRTRAAICDLWRSADRVIVARLRDRNDGSHIRDLRDRRLTLEQFMVRRMFDMPGREASGQRQRDHRATA